MKEIVVISGKGGTGKTSITAAFAVLAGSDIVLADCDVDAADMHLLMKPDFAQKETFYSGETARIIQNNCTSCGKCLEVCRFNAISIIHDQYIVNPLSCEGCGYCARVCPTETIVNEIPKIGEWYISKTRTQGTMVHAKLNIGADNSGKLVAKVKNEARQITENLGKEIILIDGSPGIGCPVVSSLSGASFVVLVTEPTVSGLHDLIRVCQLIKNFNLPAGCMINKSDINPQKSKEIMAFLNENNIPLITELPYNEQFSAAMTMGKTIVEIEDKQLSELIAKAWNTITNKYV
ncbi:MAG: 4Fe-4S binding protein [Bacteroidetes bacterium]|jgi:MinD superfamily P-loop ATPase|nr:4Fe-4S binding protein [Bacteroidota bacterium]MBT3749004.1 4Fe-4S binding protein [Bacteroidota bacterium]MBT4400888.1 4Fe-4S binding protein [Bacteroidota bacterium]MBT4408496.1 4Fe-4S binding protein [Bacteroidota bacterium]MBT5425295.1 4Fe-4S binding protein [Bacteroidota bacterium]